MTTGEPTPEPTGAVGQPRMEPSAEAVNGTVEFFRACLGQTGVFAGGPPFSRWLDGVFVEVDPGRVVMDFVVRDDMTNPAGLLHGGVQCGILDDVLGLAAFTLGRDGFHLSVNLATDYLGSARVGDTVRATAEMVRVGARVVHARAELNGLDGSPIARASSNLLHSPSTGTSTPG